MDRNAFETSHRKKNEQREATHEENTIRQVFLEHAAFISDP